MRKFFLGLCLILILAGSSWAADGTGIVSRVLAQTTVSWNGADLPPHPPGIPEITVLAIEIPAGAVLPLHKHPVINAGVLLRGELTVVTEAGQQLHLKAGDATIEVVETWHYGANEGDETAEIIVFYTGTPDKAITVTAK